MKYFFFLWVTWIYNANGKFISQNCRHENGVMVNCRCIGNEEFLLPSNFDYENLTLLTISSCASANFHFKSLPRAKVLRDILIQNVSGTLIFDPAFISKNMGTIELKNIGKISRMSHDTFINISSIDLLRIEDSKIDNFDEQFTNLNIKNLIFRNVTIEKMVGINFSGKADSLKIINSIIRNIMENVNFAFFTTIEFANSTFEFQKPSDMWIQGKIAKISNCVFSNASVNIVSRQRIIMKENCADGKSSLRLSSMSTNSVGNKLPTEIIYTENKKTAYLMRVVNNTVCIAGNCKCPKSTGHNSHSRFHANFYLGIVLLVVLKGLSIDIPY